MPFNGSGTYSPPAAPTFPAVPNTLIESTKFNTVINDIATALSLCMTRNGQSPATANIPMGTFKFTGLGNGAADTDSVALGQVPVLKGSIGASDWDTLLKTGIYEAVAASLTGPAANFPPTSTVGQLLVLSQGANVSQLYTTSSALFTRQKIGAVWSAWISTANAIRANTTLNVPGTFATIQAAMDFLDDKYITDGATVTIQVADGTIDFTSSVNLDHISGSRIQIIGNTTTPTNCVLRWNGATNPIFTITDGHKIGLINGFHFSSNSYLAIGGNSAISLSEHAFCEIGGNCRFSGWGTAVNADSGSYIILGASTFIQNGSIAVQAINSGTIRATGTQISQTDNNIATSRGLSSDNGGKIIISNVDVTTTAGNGIYIDNGAVVIVQGSGCTSSNNLVGSGIVVLNGGLPIIPQAITCDNNTRYGIEYANDGLRQMGTQSVVGAGNGIGLESNVSFMSTAQPGLLCTDGDLHLVPGGGDFVRFGTLTAAGDAASTGYIEIKDAGGTTRRLMVRA